LWKILRGVGSDFLGGEAQRNGRTCSGISRALRREPICPAMTIGPRDAMAVARHFNVHVRVEGAGGYLLVNESRYARIRINPNYARNCMALVLVSEWTPMSALVQPKTAEMAPS